MLAKGGLADPGRVRYFQDTKAADIKGGLAWAQLAAALEPCRRARPRAARLRLARQHIDQRDPDEYYGSPLRNRAALLALATEAGGREGLAEVVNAVRERLVAKVDRHDDPGTGLAAAGGAGDGRRRRRARLLGRRPDRARRPAEPVVLNPDQAAIERGMRVSNDGERPVWLQVTARGVPIDPLPAASAGAERRSASS